MNSPAHPHLPRAHPARPLRRALLLLISLLAGAIITIAIAWFAAATIDVWPGSNFTAFISRAPPTLAPGDTRDLGPVKSLDITENRRLLATGWDVSISTNDPYKATLSDPPLVIPLWLDPILRPWSSIHDGRETLTGPDWPTDIRFPRPRYAIAYIDVRAYGWPMRALYRTFGARTYDAANNPAWYLTGAYAIQGTRAPDRIATPGPIILPLLPQPTGFIIDTLVWAAIVLATITAARATLRTLRTRSRRKHNLCPHCAYDRRATPPNQPCPECDR